VRSALASSIANSKSTNQSAEVTTQQEHNQLQSQFSRHDRHSNDDAHSEDSRGSTKRQQVVEKQQS